MKIQQGLDRRFRLWHGKKEPGWTEAGTSERASRARTSLPRQAAAACFSTLLPCRASMTMYRSSNDRLYADEHNGRWRTRIPHDVAASRNPSNVRYRTEFGGFPEYCGV